MKKLLTLLTLVLFVCSGAWAVTTTLLSYTVTSESTNGSNLQAGNGTIFFGAAKFEERSVSTSGYGYKMDGDNGSKYALLTLATPFAEGDKIVITGSQASSNTTGYKFTDNTTTEATVYGTLAVANNKNEQTNTYTIPSGSDLIGKTAVYIFRNKNSIYLHKVEVTREEADNRTAINTFSFSAATTSVNLGETFTAPTLTVDPAAAASEVTYSSSATGVATVDPASGAVTIKAAGETTITAAISGSTTYQDASASYKLTVTDPNAIDVSAIWSMADGAESTGVAGADETVMKMSWEMGSNLVIHPTPTATYGGTVVTQFKPITKINDSERVSGSYIDFSMTPWKGLTFTPTAVSFEGFKVGTDGPKVDVDFIDGAGKTIKLETNAALTRNNKVGESGQANQKHSFTLTTAAASANAVTLRIYVRNCAADKNVAFGNIIISGSASGQAIALTQYTVTTSVNIDGAGTISPSIGANSVYEGNDLKLTATANTGYQFLNWTIDGTSQAANPFTIKNINENHTVVANFKQLLSVTYVAGEGEGEVPATGYADEGATYTVAPSYFLKKDGCTLTGWTDGTTTYTAGQSFAMPANNVTLTAVFTENTQSLSKNLNKTTVTWDFQQKNIGLFTSATSGWFVAKATVNDETIDMPMAFDKQIPNANWTDWANIGNKPTLSIPAISGMKVTILTYSSPSALTIAGNSDYSTSGSSAPYTTTYTYIGNDATIDIVLNDGDYIRSLSVEYPKTHTYIDVTSLGYRTFASSSALDFTDGVEGLTAYRATVASNVVSFTAIDSPVPAGEGMLIKAAGGRYYIPLASGTPAEIENAFVGVIGSDNTCAAGSFVLMNGDKGVGFYKTTAEFTLTSNTAYLPADVVAGARTFIGFDGETTTGIENVNVNVNMNDIYDMQGRRVAQPTKGLYIVNGKKVVK